MLLIKHTPCAPRASPLTLGEAHFFGRYVTIRARPHSSSRALFADAPERYAMTRVGVVRRRAAKPTRPKPPIIMAQVAGSGTALIALIRKLPA
jgi:hypothetical protein